MGRKDTVTKKYMENPVVFADAFNQYLYAGEQRIQPEQLRELDTTEIAVPYGTDGAIVPEQKYRDVLKVMTAMTDGNTAYCVMGIENQADIHYAMPVKNGVYDFLQLAHQVSEAAKTHRNTKGKVKPSGAEYLSGFWKTDKLVPVMTLVIYFGVEEWDAPLSLREMYLCQDAPLLNHVADYQVNLIAPGRMKDEEINEFHSNLREVMLYIKYSEDKQKLREIITTQERFKHVEREVVDVINTVTNSKIEYQEGEEKVDMCRAIAEMRSESEKIGEVRGEIKGAIMAYRDIGLPLGEVVRRISEYFNMSPDESSQTVHKYWEQ